MAMLLLSGCSEPGEAFWMAGHGYQWTSFNHRLSYFDAGMDAEGAAWDGIVGGTSTSQVSRADLPEGCDSDTCREFPFYDSANIAMRWVRVKQRGMVFGSGGASVIADGPGATTELVIDLGSKAKGTPAVIITGLSLDTNEALEGGTDCYRPEYGWLPTSMGIELGEPTLSDDGTQVLTSVTANFTAGLTHEEERECLDAVADEARIAVTVNVLALVTRHDLETIEINQDHFYELGDGGQFEPLAPPDPDPATRTLDTALNGQVAAGWSRLHWDFHQTHTDGRGAYIRSLTFDVDPLANFATGHSTNHSPGTQFSDYDYTFGGTVEVVEVRDTVRWGLIEQVLPVEIDADGNPVVYPLGR